MGFVFDIQQLPNYENLFIPEWILKENQNSNYQVNGTAASAAEKEFTAKGSLVKERLLGVQVLLPIRFFDGNNLLAHLPHAVITVSSDKDIVETSLPEQLGSVKEQWSINDYVFNVKGFLIADDRRFAEEKLQQLRQLYELQKAITMDNALSNIFLENQELSADEQRRVVIYDLKLDEVTGGREHIRPFTMLIKSDTVFTLELE